MHPGAQLIVTFTIQQKQKIQNGDVKKIQFSVICTFLLLKKVSGFSLFIERYVLLLKMSGECTG